MGPMLFTRATRDIDNNAESSAEGPDDINPSLVNPVLDHIAAPLSTIINCSLETGISYLTILHHILPFDPLPYLP